MNDYKIKNDLEAFNYMKSLNERGIHLYLDNETLKYKAKKEAISKKDLDKIKTNKEEIMSFLKLKKENSVHLSSLQLAYMAGQSKKQVLNKVNAHYYIEYSKDYIDLLKLEKSINMIIKQNDALRLILLSAGKGLVLDNIPEYKIKSYRYDKEIDKLNIRKKLSHKLYLYDTWPMFTIVVGKSELYDDVMHFSFDCSILDAWSAGKLTETIFKIYSGQEAKKPACTYKEYINNIRDYKERNLKILQQADDYWEERTSNISNAPELEYKKSFKSLETSTFVRQEYTFDEEELDALEKYSRENKVTLTSVVMTVYMIVLSELSSNKDLSINITIFGKLPLNKDVDDVLGEFTNVGLVEYKVKHRNFLEAVKYTQYQIFKLIEFRAYEGINILKKAKRVEVNDKRIFPVVMTCMIGENYKSILYGFKEKYSLSQSPQVSIDHHVRIINGRMNISFDYIEELFSENYIKELIEIYKKYIINICKKTREISNEG